MPVLQILGIGRPSLPGGRPASRCIHGLSLPQSSLQCEECAEGQGPKCSYLLRLHSRLDLLRLRILAHEREHDCLQQELRPPLDPHPSIPPRKHSVPLLLKILLVGVQ